VYRVSGNIGSFSIGMTGKFYLDPYGNVAYTDAQKEFVYGYLVQKKKDHFSDVKVLIFTEQNRWVTLELADKLTFGTDLGVSSSEVYDKLTAILYGGKKITFLIFPPTAHKEMKEQDGQVMRPLL
jgi:hypothetical protein